MKNNGSRGKDFVGMMIIVSVILGIIAFFVCLILALINKNGYFVLYGAGAFFVFFVIGAFLAVGHSIISQMEKINDKLSTEKEDATGKYKKERTWFKAEMKENEIKDNDSYKQ